MAAWNFFATTRFRTRWFSGVTVARQPGLYVLSGYGARGLVWSTMAAELLASQLEHDPLPLTRDLCEAVDPARFVLRPPATGRIDE